MSTPLITLYTDYGDCSAYVGILKGALWRHCPEARVVDINHRLPSRDLFEAAFCLRRLYSYYPAGTIHLVGIDSGLEPHRALLARAAGQFFLAADNGALGMVLQREVENAPPVYALEPPEPLVFLARDLLAPTAGRLARGDAPEALGSLVTDWRRLDLPRPLPCPDGVHGQILHADRFGNLMTNFHRADLLVAGQSLRCLQVGDTLVERWCRHYGEAAEGELFLLWGAEGWLEISLAHASAAERLRITAGTKVVLR